MAGSQYLACLSFGIRQRPGDKNLRMLHLGTGTESLSLVKKKRSGGVRGQSMSPVAEAYLKHTMALLPAMGHRNGRLLIRSLSLLGSSRLKNSIRSPQFLFLVRILSCQIKIASWHFRVCVLRRRLGPLPGIY